MADDRRDFDPDGVYHVTSRGNDRRTIFRDDFDRRAFLGRLSANALKHRWIVLAYCLMTNHYHLVVSAPHGGISPGMQEVNGGYSRRTNSRYGRSGHLFKNRFSATTVARDEHLLEACRYVVLNPVRAKMCKRAQDWPWSSYHACAGLRLAPRFLAVDELLGLFGNDPTDARRRYAAFVSEGPVRASDQRDETQDVPVAT
jgi:REP element-mobilizing transposase RayT